MSSQSTTVKHCKSCSNPLDPVTGLCRPCRAARSRRWYRETSTLASAQRGLRAKLKRRATLAELEEWTARVVADQDGRCACCDQPPTTTGLSLEWSLDDTADDGFPLARGALCRPCTIAVNRVIHPSKYVLIPTQLDLVEAYLEQPYTDVRGHRAPRRDESPALVRAGELADWLKTLP